MLGCVRQQLARRAEEQMLVPARRSVLELEMEAEAAALRGTLCDGAESGQVAGLDRDEVVGVRELGGRMGQREAEVRDDGDAGRDRGEARCEAECNGDRNQEVGEPRG